MKNYITVAALLAAGTAFANAGVITIAENFFGSSDQTAEFRGGTWGKPFNGMWTADSDGSGGVFGAGTTDFSIVYQYGLSGGAADWSEGRLYYGTANNGSVMSGNDPSLTVVDGSASITNVMATGQGATVAVIQNTISAGDLKSVTDLSLNFTVSGTGAIDVAVFYLADGGGQNDVKRLGLGNYSAAEDTQSLKFDYSAIDVTKAGTFVVAVRNVGATWASGSAGALTWSGTAAIPEPSAFGLLAGLGALALVASRRRRK